MLEFDSDDSRDEEISLAEARRPYQITLSTETELLRSSAAGNAKQSRGTRVSKAVFERIFLLFLTSVYIFTVAFTFCSIEGDNERIDRARLRNYVQIVQRNLMAQLHNLAPNISIDRLHQETEHFSAELLRLGWKRGKLGLPSPSPMAAAIGEGRGKGIREQQSWTFVNSLLFATSLISRIGYGHLVPLTPVGKALVAPFAIFGIPLFLLLTTELARCLSTFIHFICRKCAKCCRVCQLKTREKKETASGKAAESFGVNSASSAPVKKQKGCAGTVGRSAASRFCCGHKSSVASLNTAREFNESSTGMEELATTGRGGTRARSNDEEGSGGAGGEREEVAEGVAIWIIFIFVLFLVVWALLALFYVKLERWHWLNSAYFVFVTASSIGFGDFAPTTTLSTLVTVFLIIPVLAFLTLLNDTIAVAYLQKFHFVCNKLAQIYKLAEKRLISKKRKRTRRA